MRVKDHESVDLPTYPWDLAFSVSQTTPPEPTRIASTQSSHTPIEAPGRPSTGPHDSKVKLIRNLVDQVNPWDSTPSGAIYPWDLTPPISPTNSSDSHRTVPSVSLSQTTSASGEWWVCLALFDIKLTRFGFTGPEKLAIYPLDSTPPQPRTTFPKSGDVSVFISSQTPVDRSKSTFSTVTRQLVTSVLSFTSVQPTASRGASAVESLRSSKNFNAVPKCDGQRNSPSKFTLSVRIFDCFANEDLTGNSSMTYQASQLARTPPTFLHSLILTVSCILKTISAMCHRPASHSCRTRLASLPCIEPKMVSMSTALQTQASSQLENLGLDRVRLTALSGSTPSPFGLDARMRGLRTARSTSTVMNWLRPHGSLTRMSPYHRALG